MLPVLSLDATAEAAAANISGSSTSALSPATVTGVHEHDDDPDDATVSNLCFITSINTSASVGYFVYNHCVR